VLDEYKDQEYTPAFRKSLKSILASDYAGYYYLIRRQAVLALDTGIFHYPGKVINSDGKIRVC